MRLKARTYKFDLEVSTNRVLSSEELKYMASRLRQIMEEPKMIDEAHTPVPATYETEVEKVDYSYKPVREEE